MAIADASLPSAPTKLTISHIESESVQLSWDKANTGDVLSYIILFRPYKSNREFKEIVGVKKTRGYIVHPLKPNTRYEFKVLATNKNGRGLASESVLGLTGPTG